MDPDKLALQLKKKKARFSQSPNNLDTVAEEVCF